MLSINTSRFIFVKLDSIYSYLRPRGVWRQMAIFDRNNFLSALPKFTLAVQLTIMKKIILIAALLIGILFLESCLTTLHPIFTEKDLVFDPRLAGNWKKAKDGSTAIYRQATSNDLKTLSPALQQNANKIYILEKEDAQSKAKSSYYVFLVKLGKYYYLDYYPAGLKENQSADEFFAIHYIPMHSIYRVKFNGNLSFDLQQLDGGYLENLIRNKKIRIRHEVTDDGNYVITAPTEDLQQYLIKYSDVPEAYSNDNRESYNKIN